MQNRPYKRYSPYPRRKKVAVFRAYKPSLFDRLVRLILNPWTVSILSSVTVAAFLTAIYFWLEYSAKIDLMLKGEIFTRNAGIYSAPKTLYEGENISIDELTRYLKSAGYVEKNSKADESRSRYQVTEQNLLIEPGSSAVIDGEMVFTPVSVKFSRDWKKVESITDLRTSRKIKRTKLEPQILSSLAAEGDGRRKVVSFKDLPEHLIKAITVTEDRAFFEHYGINFRGILRALWRRYESEENSPIAYQGGSSITQQLVKNLFLTPEKTIKRKLQEAYMSIILETRLTKEQIFTLYVNQIYLGQQAGVAIYGVGEAANAYFGKDVSQLDLAESAFIAGLIRSPNRYSPYKSLERATERRNQVLISMLEEGAISEEQFNQAKLQPLKIIPPNRPELLNIPYFTQYVEEELAKYVNDPEALQNLRIYTTIDVDLQQAAYRAVTKQLQRLEKLFLRKDKSGLQAALVALNPKTGDIVAMIGGRNFLENQFNRATSAMRQPGSVFKPIVYAAAINSVYDPSSRIFTAATTLKDEKKVFTYGREMYSPNNYGDVFTNKEITLRDALVKSKNTVTVELAMELNIGKVMNLAHKFGLPKVEKAYPSMALGTAEATPLQIATAYTVFANLGERVTPKPISAIATGNGETLIRPSSEKLSVLRPDVVYIVNDMLKDVINRGTGAAVQSWGIRNSPGRAFAGKTGTSRDAWFAGFTPNLVCVVYVGFDDGSDLGLKGADAALPIWADFMKEALELYPEWNGDWHMPDTIVKAEIDIRTGKVIRELGKSEAMESGQKQSENETKSDHVPSEFRRVELFISGTIPNFTFTNEEPVETEPSDSPTPFKPWIEEENDPVLKTSTPEEEIQKPIVKVTVCSTTGFRATASCPDKKLVSFHQGDEPKDYCFIHSPSPKN
ncbi:MAG: PBP1A family penicillin-binding protein [Pyrinomonadaceae bacterium]|nr:PBP1A family penicillin-binding protein [Pyrinomonadaceae bacterium]MCX7639340.1 PBP1A family penicillin-binding protein [Pyrinomonadaceae bacterium]MDW8305244.1 PBP1A family penicillin-binding protein [Acidobacteriota bacterium]